MANTTKKTSKAARKHAAATEAQLKELLKQEKSVKKQLSVLECSIVALPATYQESRLKNWNILPPPEEYRAKKPAPLARVHQQHLRQARMKQALFAMFLVTLMLLIGAWFYTQLQAQHLLD
jgi:septal ring factor EnvC (AmiA/AmiB activator)